MVDDDSGHHCKGPSSQRLTAQWLLWHDLHPMNSWSAIAVLALAVSATSVTIGRTAVFAPFRDWFEARSTWIHGLVSCPYCLSHWIAFLLAAWYRPRIVQSSVPFVDVAVSAFA